MTSKKDRHIPILDGRLVKHKPSFPINRTNRFTTLGSTVIVRNALATLTILILVLLLIHINSFSL